MPVGGDRFYFFLDGPLPKDTPPQGNIRQELAHHFAGWATPVQTLIETLDPERTNRIPIHDVEPLETFVRGRVALLGDAHTAPPPIWARGAIRP